MLKNAKITTENTSVIVSQLQTNELGNGLSPHWRKSGGQQNVRLLLSQNVFSHFQNCIAAWTLVKSHQSKDKVVYYRQLKVKCKC